MVKDNKKKILNNLKTARGQLEGIIKMIEDEKYCIDISRQLLAVQSIVKKSNFEILNNHIKGCVKTALESEEGKHKVDEIFEIITTYAK